MSGPDQPNPPPHRRRLRRIDGHNHARFLTFTCYHGRPFLKSERACRWLLRATERARAMHGFHLWAFVFMPTHAHFLIYPDPRRGSRVGPALASMKQSVSKRAAAFTRRHRPDLVPRFIDRAPSGRETFRFWQRGGGYDRNLWSPDHIWETIEYIHQNPVEHGLCKWPEEWPWSSAAEYANRGAGPLRIDFDSIPRDAMR